MPASFQPDLPFYSNDRGYEQWQTELDAWRARFEARFGIPLGRPARVTLRDFAHPFDGVIELVVGTDNTNPRLRIRGFRFDFSIEEIVSLERGGSSMP